MRLNVADKTGRVAWQKMQVRDFSELCFFAIHRIGPVLDGKRWDNAEGLAEFFMGYSDVGSMAYSILIHPNGFVEQAVPLSRVTPHAYRQNRRAIGIALVRDETDTAPPPAEQWQSLIEVLIELCQMFPGVPVSGHDEIPDGSKDTKKVCPGIDMDAVRDSVDLALGRMSESRRLVI